MKQWYVLTFLILCGGCKDSSTSDLCYFPVVQQIVDYDSIYSDKTDLIGRIRDIGIIDNVIITQNAQNDYLFSFINAEKGTLATQWGRIGRGPNEFIQIGTGFSICNSRLVFIDAMKKEMSMVTIADILNGTDPDIIKEPFPYTRDFRPTQMVKIGDKKVALGGFDKGRFGILDLENKIVECQFDYPFYFDEIQGIYRGSVFQSRIGVNGKNNKFVIMTLISDNFEIYEMTDTILSRVYKSPSEHTPKIVEKRRPGVTHTIDYDNSIAGLLKMAVSEDLICFTYSSQAYSQSANLGNSSNEILCFNWHGEKIKKYVLPFSISSFCIDRNYIYGVKDCSDNTVIYRFAMN